MENLPQKPKAGHHLPKASQKIDYIFKLHTFSTNYLVGTFVVLHQSTRFGAERMLYAIFVNNLTRL